MAGPLQGGAYKTNPKGLQQPLCTPPCNPLGLVFYALHRRLGGPGFYAEHRRLGVHIRLGKPTI
jgi:hypothetical protein